MSKWASNSKELTKCWIPNKMIFGLKKICIKQDFTIDNSFVRKIRQNEKWPKINKYSLRFCFFFLCSSAYALKCWQCNSSGGNAEFCKDPFQVNGTNHWANQDCPATTPENNMYCRKSVEKGKHPILILEMSALFLFYKK